ncbi:MAG: hypothetical protein AABY07_00085 [Nanoarchaeota archaeon]
MNITETKELVYTKRVLEAANKCPSAKEVLEALFPECFKGEKKYFDLSKLFVGKTHTRIFPQELSKSAGFEDNQFIQVRNGGAFAYKGLFLSSQYNWELIEDSGNLCLIPTKKTDNEQSNSRI